jgi:flagellum-specific peptidoglycan hydrolase FlgJ
MSKWFKKKHVRNIIALITTVSLAVMSSNNVTDFAYDGNVNTTNQSINICEDKEPKHTIILEKPTKRAVPLTPCTFDGDNREVNTEVVRKKPKTTSPTKKVKNTQITYNKKINDKAFKKTIKKIAPELSGIESSILKVYKETGIKPSFQLAKFCLESGYGKSNLSKYKNNIAGWNAYPTRTKTAYANALSFKSKNRCVEVVGKSLYKNYVKKDLTTIKSISKVYCPDNSTNWSNDVLYLMKQIDKIYYKYI